MSPICKASSAAVAAGGPGDAGAEKVPSAGVDPAGVATVSTGSSAGQEGRGESSAGSANVDPSANARLKESLEDYEPMVVRTLASPELPSQAEIDEHNVSRTEHGAGSASWAGGKQTFT